MGFKIEPKIATRGAARPASDPPAKESLAGIDARIAELSKTWANARAPAQKRELAELKARRQTLVNVEPAPRLPAASAPVLNTIRPTATGVVPSEVLDRAQAQLDAGDRGGAYLTLYRELGNEQLLVQAQITTYSGIWGSGALTGNAMAKSAAGERYNLPLDQFSHDIDRATIDAIRADIKAGGTGRLSDDQFQDADRGVWRDKKMESLFPGNIHFGDFVVGNHSVSDGAAALFSRGSWNAIQLGLRNLVPDTSLFGLNQDGRNMANQVGKRPAEFANDPNYTTHGGKDDRFITVIDNRTGFVEVFFDQQPKAAGVRIPQLPNEPLAKDTVAFRQRHTFYEYLGANRHRPRQ